MDLPVDHRNACRRLCAVTGGRGFMARHLVMALLRSGDWRVRITDLGSDAALSPAEDDRLLEAALRDGRATYVPADVCKLEHLTKAFEGVDTVFHTAAPDHSNNNFQLHYKVNVQGTKNVIEACKECKVKKLIYTSSSGVVFDGVHGLFGVDESTPYPDKFPDAYTQTKAEAEKLVIKANKVNGLLTCCIRPGSIFGPGDMIVPILVSYGGIILIIGDGKNCDDFVYVENVVHGHICAEKTLSTKHGAKRSGGKAYFITNMEPVNMWDFFYMLLEELGYKSRFRLRIASYLLMPITHLVEWSYNNIFSLYGMRQPGALTSARIKYVTLNRTFNCNNASKHLGYRPIVSLKEGVNMTIEFYKKLRA
ncbi:3beta-hydroxysteroid-dehydrogenase/decarboxylase-like isoform X2 [Triticum dicoccoides]|uniref:3beta-hydroxysteroid- dehydrogenase/decarboxylase-like isoform X2 n=1 Tax=Triticum dicoccoides TaxID=85692 RepID=UPI000E7A3D6E|nr:3beta-hydroxysteroid-dehydrogenase/decarboxylase-like isoform X2 [Triticum dicoccoides]